MKSKLKLKLNKVDIKNKVEFENEVDVYKEVEVNVKK